MLLKYLDENLSDIKGDYICVSNVHTTVTSYENVIIIIFRLVDFHMYQC